MNERYTDLSKREKAVFFIGLIVFFIITVSLLVWVGEEGWIFFGAVIGGFIGYGIGETRGVSKVSKGKQAKEEARTMIDTGQICGATEVDRNHGMTYGAEKFWGVYEILKSEAHRHKTEAEEEEKLLSDLLDLSEKPKSKTQ